MLSNGKYLCFANFDKSFDIKDHTHFHFLLNSIVYVGIIQSNKLKQ